METKQENSNLVATGCTGCAACHAGSTHTPGTCGCPGPSQHGTASARDPRPIPQSWRPQGAPANLACLEVLGSRLAHALFYRASGVDLPLVSNRCVLAQAVAMTADLSQRSVGLSWQQALVLAASHLQHLAETGEYSQATVDKVLAEAGKLALFMTNSRSGSAVSDASTMDLRQWAQANHAGRRNHGLPPAAATVRLRLTTIRIFLAVLRRLGLYVGDPLAEVSGPSRSPHRTRPLSDAEIVLVRLSCNDIDGTMRKPAAIALAEATAVSGELCRVLVKDINLDAATVQLPGAERRAVRIGYLSSWGVRQLRARIAYLRRENPGVDVSDLPVVYYGTKGGDSAGSAGSILLGQVLKIAGLAGLPGIKPASVSTAFGRRLWEQARDLPLVASALGCASYDTAAREIGLTADDQRAEAAEALRAATLDESMPMNALRGTRRVLPKPANAPATRTTRSGER